MLNKIQTKTIRYTTNNQENVEKKETFSKKIKKLREKNRTKENIMQAHLNEANENQQTKYPDYVTK